MFRYGPLYILFRVSSIKQSLKVLELAVPTSRSQIKKQYLLLAKKYHPDSSDTSKSSGGVKNNQLQTKFVNVNKAYQYLRNLTDQQINNNRDKAQGSNADQRQRQSKKRSMTMEEIQRQQTYEYFNRKYHQQLHYQNIKRNRKDEQYLQQNNRVPISKAIPQFYLGFLLLAAILGDWAYRVMKRKYSSAENKNGQQPKENLQNQQVGRVFKRMSYSNREKKYRQVIE